MEIIISNTSGIPIYEQIKEEIKAKIIMGELQEGELLPSIRALAKDLRCSVITTKNAYEELAKEGFVKTIPTKGFYVSKINKDLIKESILNRIEDYLEKAIEIAKINKITKKEMKDIIDILYEEDKNE